MEKKTIHQDLYISLVFLAFEIYLFGLTATFKVAEVTAIFPRLILSAMMVLTILLFIRALTQTIQGKGTKVMKLKDMKMSFAAYGIFVIYVLIFWKTNYFIAAPILLISFFIYMGLRNWKQIALIVAVYLVIIYIVFVKILGIAKLIKL